MGPLIAAANEVLQFSNCLARDGTNAALKIWDYGKSSWHLSNKVTSPAITSRYRVAARRADYRIASNRSDQWQSGLDADMVEPKRLTQGGSRACIAAVEAT
jgi:hypothetical protein